MPMATPAAIGAMHARADRIRNMIQARAVKAFAAQFGDHGGMCFALAHNWQDLPHLTKAQRHACRYVLHLERNKLWTASRIVDAWYNRKCSEGR